MGFKSEQVENIERVLKTSLRQKFANYNPEPAVMPFHTRLLGKDRLALYSFIHSLNTNFGTTIFEPVALELGKINFKNAKSQFNAGDYISEAAQFEIQKIIDKLTIAETYPNKPKEIEILRKVSNTGSMRKVKSTKVDIMLESHSNELFLFDLKTAKPNKGGFKEFKRTLLEWVATTFFNNPELNVNSLIAIPYNPYEPEPYNRWTIRGMLDLKFELKVGEEFWDFLGGDGAYNDLLDCFERVGIELRGEIDEYFERFRRK